MKRRPNNLVPGVFAALVVAGASTLLWSATRTPGPPPSGVTNMGSIVSPAPGGGGSDASPEPIVVAPSPIGKTDLGGARTATIFGVVTDDDGSRLKAQKLNLNASAGKGPERIAVAALNAMAKLKDSPLPKGTEARSVKIGADGVATVDFNQAAKDNFIPGDENEALFINAVLGTLAQFPGVQKVQFLVEGAKIDAFGGTMTLTEPLAVTPSDDAAQTAQGGGQP